MLLGFWIEYNKIITQQIKALSMVFALHKFRHYFLGNKCLLCRSYGIGLFGQQTTCFKENNYGCYCS